MNSNNSNVQLSDLVYDAKQVYGIYYVQTSGLLFGKIMLATSQLSIQRICFSQILTANITIDTFGLISLAEGSISLFQCYIINLLQSSLILQNVAIIGKATLQCIYLNIYNLNVTFSMDLNKGSQIAAILAVDQSVNCTIINSSVTNSSIIVDQISGGFIATASGVLILQQCSIQMSNISGNQFSGGLVGQSNTNTLQILQCFTQYNFVNSGNSVGGLIGITFNKIIISNTTVQFCKISFGQLIGGLIGFLEQSSTLYFSRCYIINISMNALGNCGGLVGNVNRYSNLMISEVIVSNSNISSPGGSVGGFIGCFGRQSEILNMKLVTSKINSITITCTGSCGLFMGLVPGGPTYTVSNSFIEGNNTINGVKQQNCFNFIGNC
ncbi:Conserved_hypothetical protein [Hexamita inflata]|uniref:Transmembrane protein n=1 Tax=Hexamita inflata TaxID=28002 RepID=A0ABP1GGB9_9EUKA